MTTPLLEPFRPSPQSPFCYRSASVVAVKNHPDVIANQQVVAPVPSTQPEETQSVIGGKATTRKTPVATSKPAAWDWANQLAQTIPTVAHVDTSFARALTAQQQYLDQIVGPSYQQLSDTRQQSVLALSASLAYSVRALPQIASMQTTIRQLDEINRQFTRAFEAVVPHLPLALRPEVLNAMLLPASAVQLAQLAQESPLSRLALTQAKVANASYQQFSLDLLGSLKQVTGGPLLNNGTLAALSVGKSILDTAMQGLQGFAYYEASHAPVRRRKVIMPTIYEAITDEVHKREDILITLDLAEAKEHLAGSLPMKIANAAKRMADVRFECGRIANILGLEVVFKPTVESEWVAAMVPQHVASDQNQFVVFIDYLYKIIYESSGQYNRVKPLVSAELLEDALSIKYFRHYYRHDPEHGDNKKVIKDHARVKGLFVTYGGAAVLSTPAQRQQMQLALLELVAHRLTDVRLR